MYRPTQKNNRKTITTIGHSNHPLSEFMRLLKMNRIQEVVDVRSTPFSRHVPHFSRDHLAGTLEQAGVAYTFMGDTLGGRPSDPEYYDQEGRVQYHLAAQSPDFQEAIDELAGRAGNWETALMCTEGDPLRCHRTLMVAHNLEKAGAQVVHILPDGKREDHDMTISRLLEKWPQRTSPTSRLNRKELVEWALRQQNRAVGYAKPKPRPAPAGMRLL